MAPALIENEAAAVAQTQKVVKKSANIKVPRTVYILDKWDAKATSRARELFENVVLNSDDEFQGWQEKAEALLVRGSYLQADTIAKCPNLLAVGKHGVGIDKIDAEACKSRGIQILNTPGANSQAVAEIVIALTLAVARRIPSIYATQLSMPVPKETCTGLTLEGKTVAIIGMGNIGRRTAKIFHGGFDCPILAYDPFMPADAWSDIPHTRVTDFREMLPLADVISLHVPLVKDTANMLSYPEFQKMKPSTIVINASRGGVVNEKDLERALKEGLLWGAGLDAHQEEPPTKETYGSLWELPSVVSTPHIGAATTEAQEMSALMAVENLYKYLRTCA